MPRTIKTTASAAHVDILQETLNELMMDAAETLTPADVINDIIDIEEHHGIRFTDRQIVRACNAAANDMVDSYVANAFQTTEIDKEERDRQVAYFEAMRPSTKRRAQLTTRFTR